MGMLGYFSLILAMLVSLGTALVFISTVKDKSQRWTTGKIGVYVSFGLVTLAVVLLEIALLTHNFSIEYVAEYTNRDLSFSYLVSGLWAGNAGSLLFWAWVLSLFGTVLVARWKDRGRALLPGSSAVIMVVLAFFLVLMVFVVNPFKGLSPVPEDGRGLNPLLENPAMVIHPPLLLAGYVTFAIPFAIGIAALASRKLNEDWLVKARGWAVLGWLLLGAGNLIGAWWAYVELGWGGYWAWDPVENAGLMPWLVGTAFLHATNIQRRRKTFKIWTMGLLIFTFFLTIFGTFLTRSNFLKSVHNFGDTGLDAFFTVMLIIIFFGSFALLIARRNDLKGESEIQDVVSREGTFLLTNLLLLASTLAILFATIAPKFMGTVSGDQVEVNKPFFNMVNVPIFMLLITLAGICIVIGWRKASMKELGKDLLIPAIVFVLILGITLVKGVLPVASVAYAFAGFTLSGTIAQWVRELVARNKIKGESAKERMSTLGFMAVNKNRYGAYIVHISLAMIAIGMIGSSLFDVEKEAVLNPGESLEIKDYTVTYEGTDFTGTMSKMAINARVTVYKDGKQVAKLTPQKFIHASFDQEVTEVAIRTTPLEDLYVILADWNREVLAAPEDRVAAFRVLVNPLVIWIWVGGILLGLGGIICFWPQKDLMPVKAESRPVQAEKQPVPQAGGRISPRSARRKRARR